MRFHSRSLSSRAVFLILVFVILAAVMIVVALVEVWESRRDLLVAAETEARVLVTALTRSSAATIVSNTEMERLIEERLGTVGRLVDHLEEHRAASRASLQALCAELDVTTIALAADSREIAATSASLRDTAVERRMTEAARARLAKEDATVARIGIGRFPGRTADDYIVAVRRTRGRGIVLVGLDAARLAAFRRKVGIGRLIQELAAQRGITFIVLQDDEGILAASRGVQDIGSIQDDTLVQSALSAGAFRSRIIGRGGASASESRWRWSTHSMFPS